MPAEQNSSRGNAALVGDGDDRLGSEEGAASAAERAVSSDVNTLLLTEIDDLLLRQRGVVLNLIGSGDNGGLGQELLQVLDTVVGDTNGPNFSGADELLHALPGSNVLVRVVNVPRSIGELGEDVVVSCAGKRLVQLVYDIQFGDLNSPLGFMARGQCMR